MTPLQEQFAQVVGGQYLEAYLALPFCVIKFVHLSICTQHTYLEEIFRYINTDNFDRHTCYSCSQWLYY